MADLSRHRWVLVADSEMLPVYNGGRKENWGLLTAAAEAGILALMVLPHSTDVDVDEYRAQLGGVPVVTVPRRMAPVGVAHPTEPFTTLSRPAPANLAARVKVMAPDVTGTMCLGEKSVRILQALATGLSIPAVVRQHNLEADYHWDLGRGTAGPRKLAYAVESRKIARLERALYRSSWLTGHADISPADARARAALGARSFYVPTFASDPALREVPRTPAEQPTVVFTGSLAVQTNTEAVAWLVDKVWPRVRAAMPEAQLSVVGRDPSPALVAKLEQPGVRLHPNVPSVTEHLAGAWVGVNPAVIGSGVNIKLTDYLQAGLPIVSTKMATASLDVADGEHLLIRDSPDTFADAVVQLLRDRELAQRLGDAGKARALELLDPHTNLGRIADVLDGDTSHFFTA